MNCWDILGLAPTADTAAVRHAFAEKSKTCHPEDDPEGFATLRNAYRTAMFEAARLAEDAPEESPAAPQTPPPAPAVEQTAPPPPAADAPNGASAPGLDFSRLEESIQRQDAKTLERINCIFQQLHAIYALLHKNPKHVPRQTIHAQWRTLTTGADFLKLQNNALFTQRFLEFLLNSPDLMEIVMADDFMTLLSDWKFQWNGTPLWNSFEKLQKRALAIMVIKRQAEQKRRSRRRTTIALAVCAAIILGASLAGRLTATGSRGQTSTQLYAPGTAAATSADEQLRQQIQQSTQTNTYNTIGRIYSAMLPLSAKEKDTLRQEAAHREALAAHLAQAAPWQTAKPGAEALGIAKAVYEALLEQYESGEGHKARAAIETYRPQEQAIIQNTLIPFVKSAILAGEDGTGRQLSATLMSLGLAGSQYDAMLQGYAAKGEDWVDTQLAENCTRLIFNFPVEE